MRSLRVTSWYACALMNALALASIAGWMILDPALGGETSDGNNTLVSSLASFASQLRELDTARFGWMLTLLAVAGVSAIGWAVISLVGPIVDRSIRSGLAMILMTALWILCLGQWHEFGWLGKRLSCNICIDEFTEIASDLESNWPQHDEDRSGLGPFLAYPTNRPMSLVLMSSRSLGHRRLAVNGVERTPDGGLAFLLVGPAADGFDAVEWHPLYRAPMDFTTGLLQPLSLQRSTRLSEHWYLCRYRNGPLSYVRCAWALDP